MKKNQKISIFKCLKIKYLNRFILIISTDKITEIFCFIDEFHQEFEYAENGHLLHADCNIKQVMVIIK